MLDLLVDAVTWLAPRSDQWHDALDDGRPAERIRHRYADAITAGTCQVIRLDGEIVATMILDTEADPDFWPPPSAPEDALYVHQMIVSRKAAGRGIGGQLLAWARTEALRQGKPYVRLDAWRTNERLQRCYRDQGFEQVATLRLAHRKSGALFQADALVP
ncbi:MAG: GNAT family N-acetyltransferase [Nocardioides sp.]